MGSSSGGEQAVRPELSQAMRLQLREAFDLIDQDGSGAIDVDELEEAFKVSHLVCTRSPTMPCHMTC